MVLAKVEKFANFFFFFFSNMLHSDVSYNTEEKVCLYIVSLRL